MGGGVPSGILSQDLTYSGKTKPIQVFVCHFKNAWLNKRVVNTFSALRFTEGLTVQQRIAQTTGL